MPRILVIDDEQLLRSTVVMILTRAGFIVVEASDGQAGIAMFHKNPPDIVLTDIFMPNQESGALVWVGMAEWKSRYLHARILQRRFDTWRKHGIMVFSQCGLIPFIGEVGPVFPGEIFIL